MKSLFPQNLPLAESLEKIGSAAGDQLSARFNVLVWNIYKGRRRQWQTDFARLAAVQDLILLQESIMHGRHDNIFLDQNRIQWVMAKSFSRRGVDMGVKTGAAATAQTAAAFHSAAREPLWRTRKSLLATHYKIAGSADYLLVLNMHAINFVSLAKFKAHLAQLADAIGQHAGPIFLGGDFNTWSQKRFKHFTATMAQHSLHEAPLERETKLRHFNRHLDHVFYRGLRLESARVLADIGSSDHHPIEAVFTVKP